MSVFDPRIVLAILGPVFLLLALRDRSTAGRLTPRARAWFTIGLIFSAVAVWLWWPVIASA
ncbi:MAG: hypothetical protein Tsb007_00490 [Rhizobacter sp.]